MAGKRVLYTDIETFSGADLKSTGSYKYIEDSNFEILLLAFAWDDGAVGVLDLTDPADHEELQDVIAGLKDPDVIKVAHNTAFERKAYHRAFGFYQPPKDWVDTMILCAMNGLPMSLEAAGEALGLEQQKIKEGTALISYFCKPCKPTISNGGRTRNLPEHAKDKWERFKEYAKRDVEVMRTIYKMLKSFPVPEFERELWAIDAKINERGVMVDTELVEAAIAVDDAFTKEHTEEMQKLTGLDNPNSVSQLKDWLSVLGIDCDSLNKETVGDLKKTVTDPTTRRVLELRQLLGKTSTTKYKAMTNAACEDSRVRGLLQYYGAGRTGRWAGRLVQVQNLPQNHLDDIGNVREIVRQRDLETLEMCFDSVPDVLSQLIRTAFIAKDGHTFLVADYSAIEARVIAYLAGEQWRMDVFANGGDIYCSSASQMFKVPVEKHGVNAHLRQKGKVAELACIAEGQEVLTDQGLVPIENVTKNMKLWDGVEWVNHDGVIYRGEKEVITYEGLTATADHVVWAEVNGKNRTIQFGDAATRGTRLVQTGYGREAIWLGGNNQSRETLERNMEPLLCSDEVHRMRPGAMARTQQPCQGKIQRMSTLLRPKSHTSVAIQTIHCRKAEMHQPEGSKLQKLWRARHRVPFRECKCSRALYDRNMRNSIKRYGAGQNRRQWALRDWESSVGYAPRELQKSTPIRCRVFDILNAGPRHRFTVSNVLVHNCGYGGGVAALKAFGAEKMGLTEAEMQDIVNQWRLASPTIPRLWRRIEDAARAAIENPGRRCVVLRKYQDAERAKLNELRTGGSGYSPEFNAGGAVCTFWRDKYALRCKLPSGRVLSYWGARLDESKKICFMGQNQTTRKWEKTDTWGGKLVENVVQAFARDCLAVAILRLANAGFDICFHVHDEIVAEAPIGTRWQDMAKIMGQQIEWAPGLLLTADGYETIFYRKD